MSTTECLERLVRPLVTLVAETHFLVFDRCGFGPPRRRNGRHSHNNLGAGSATRTASFRDKNLTKLPASAYGLNDDVRLLSICLRTDYVSIP